MSDTALRPSVALLSKLGSIAVHADEFTSAGAHEYDRIAIRSLLDDPEVRQWIADMKAFLPVKRAKGGA